jgi:tRNA (uracil-5-)-methyltransferase TRM9
MRSEVARQLLEVNRNFYESFADDFSATRLRIQSGVMRITAGIPEDARIFDLGCGNGNLAVELGKQGFYGQYLGLDQSVGLTNYARSHELDFAIFQQADLTSNDWDVDLPDQSFDILLCFATIHHIPSLELRVRFLEKVRRLIRDDGQLIFSTWQFLNSPRLAERVQPWERVGLSIADVDEGDYLMDWKRGGDGLRYVHVYSPEELYELAQVSGFRVEDQFSSDGSTGDLGLYMVWGK